MSRLTESMIKGEFWSMIFKLNIAIYNSIIFILLMFYGVDIESSLFIIYLALGTNAFYTFMALYQYFTLKKVLLND